jgi:hypothetical protein
MGGHRTQQPDARLTLKTLAPKTLTPQNPSAPHPQLGPCSRTPSGLQQSVRSKPPYNSTSGCRNQSDRTMKATKPQLRPLRRSSSVRGHMTLTEAMAPKRPNSRLSTSSSVCGAQRSTSQRKTPVKRWGQGGGSCKAQAAGTARAHELGLCPCQGCTAVLAALLLTNMIRGCRSPRTIDCRRIGW